MGKACLIELRVAWVTRVSTHRCGSGPRRKPQGGPRMGIGGSIFLLALGAILAFAVNANFSGIDINVVGYVLMMAGLVGLIITVWFWNSRRRPTTTVTSSTQQPVVRN